MFLSQSSSRQERACGATAHAQLGFGTSTLGGRIGPKASLRLLEAAFDQGIRYFDTAPMYGYGATESIVGEFASKRRDQLILSTKFGIEPAPRSRLLHLARAGARVLVTAVPSLRARLVQRGEQMIKPGQFDLRYAAMSLERSLKALQSEYVDVYLMHEIRAGQITPELLHLLSERQQAGTIRQFGVASTRDEIRQMLKSGQPHGTVLQMPDAFPAAAEPLPPSDSMQVTHSIFGREWRLFQEAIQDAQTARGYSARLDCDCSDRYQVGRLFLSAAMARNPGGTVLFSSQNPQTIERNARLAIEPEFTAEQHLRLQQLVDDLLKKQQRPLDQSSTELVSPA